MNKELATIIAALIVAIFGSIGTAYVRNSLERRNALNRRRERVLQSYLLQLQDALESLRFRFLNLADRRGRSVMTEAYFEQTTVYAWARAIAYSRILLLDGIYAQLSKQFANTLKTGFDNINGCLKSQNSKFHYYDRIALAEALMLQERGRLRPITYLEFRSGKVDISQWPFKEASAELDSFTPEILHEACRQIETMLRSISDETRIKALLSH